MGGLQHTGGEASAALHALREEYARSLERFLSTADECSLEDAYELGRTALSGGVGVVQLAWVHHDALAQILPQMNEASRARAALMASRFFAECLAPIEMLQRGVRNSLEQMRFLNGELQARADEVAAARDTIVRLARQRSVFLAQVSLKLSMSLDLSRTTRRIARLAVPRLAEWAALDSELEGEWTRRVAAQPGVLWKRELEALGPDALTHEVRRTGRAVQLELSSHEAARRWGRSEEQSRRLAMTGTSHVLALPLFDRRQVAGVLLLTRPLERPFGEGQREEIDEFTRRASSALINARLFHQTQTAVKLRDDFLSIASHELRTPLTPMLLSLQRLLASPSLTKGDERLVHRAITQVHRFTTLVNDLLDVGRIQSGQLDLVHEAVAVEELVRSTVGLFQTQSPRHRVILEQPSEGPHFVRGDRDRLEQVLANLLDNAIKYSPGGGEIRVELNGGKERVEVAVRDPGIGIPEDQLELIFGRFFRARNASVRHFGGLGLGLHISNEIVQRHGGRIQVESRVGEGSTFRVELPLLDQGQPLSRGDQA